MDRLVAVGIFMIGVAVGALLNWITCCSQFRALSPPEQGVSCRHPAHRTMAPSNDQD